MRALLRRVQDKRRQEMKTQLLAIFFSARTYRIAEARNGRLSAAHFRRELLRSLRLILQLL